MPIPLSKLFHSPTALPVPPPRIYISYMNTRKFCNRESSYSLANKKRERTKNTQTMNAVISAVVSDFISRFISFLIERSQQQVQFVTDDKKIVPRLQRLLLRAGAVVEEAEGRRITNRAMLLQLKQLREAMYRGYYELDTFGAEPECHGTRACVETIVGSRRRCRIRRDTDNLEATLDGMKEFLLFLMQRCPPVVRRPYDTYLFMENCMFGRRTEKERVLSFLLRPCSSLEVLPVVGPSYIGKRTLVEHACRDEAVRGSFSRILNFRSDDLHNLLSKDDGAAMDDYCREKLCPSSGKFLVVVELVDGTDETAWDKICSSLRHGAGAGSKVILISTEDRVSSSSGTVQALRLTRLHEEEYWYFFRVLAFGSANPFDHHPDLAVIGKEIAAELEGYFMIAIVITRLLRAHMNVQFWQGMLRFVRRSNQMRVLVFGEDPTDIFRRRFCPCFCSYGDAGSLVLCYNRFEVAGAMVQGDMVANPVKAEDVLSGKVVIKQGEKFDMVTQSPMPPYYYYVTNCIVEKQVHSCRNKSLKRKRNPKGLPHFPEDDNQESKEWSTKRKF